jgi:cbb3-type cytochrome oxidase maturation protein
MSVVIILIAASLLVAIGFLAAFIWSVKSGQYDDDYTPSVRMLFDTTAPLIANDLKASQAHPEPEIQKPETINK